MKRDKQRSGERYALEDGVAMLLVAAPAAILPASVVHRLAKRVRATHASRARGNSVSSN
jgi:hypothetical protein